MIPALSYVRPGWRGLPRTTTGARSWRNGNALAGVWKDRLIARLGPDEGEAALREPHVRSFNITGRPMRNWVAVEPEGVEDDDQLKAWVERVANSSKSGWAKTKWPHPGVRHGAERRRRFEREQPHYVS